MDKAKQVELLKQALGEISYLRTLDFGNGELTRWTGRVSHLLESAYGRESADYRRFAGAPGTAFVVRTQLGQEQEYHRQLDCYEEVLQSLVAGNS